MGLTKAYQWIKMKIHKAQEYYEQHGVRKLTLYCFSRIGIIFKREGIFFELRIEDIVPYGGNTIGMDLEFVTIKKEDDFEQIEFPDDDEWMTKDGALQWLHEKDCMLLALKRKNNIVCYQWLEFARVSIPFLALKVYLPDDTAYSSALYTVSEYRGRGVASYLKALVLQYAQEQGYHRVFLGIEPDNVASQKVNKKFGFREYQAVLCRKFLFLRYYRLKDYDSNKIKVLWSVTGKVHELWKTFSKLDIDQQKKL